MGTAELKPGQTHIAPSSQNRWQGIIFNTGGRQRVYPQAGAVEREPDQRRVPLGAEQERADHREAALHDEPTLVYFPRHASTASSRAAAGSSSQQGGGLRSRCGPRSASTTGSRRRRTRRRPPTQRFIALTNAASPIIFEAGRAAVVPELRGVPEPHPEQPAQPHERARVNYTGSRRHELHDVPRHRRGARGSTAAARTTRRRSCSTARS